MEEEDGQIVAQLVVQLVPLVPRPCRAQDVLGLITDNYTSPEYRSRGIGRVLLERATHWARDKDLELLVVWPSDRAADWYKRNGFQPDEAVLARRLRPYYDRA